MLTLMTDRCILQVDDDKNDAFLLRAVFAEAGISNPVHVVTNGQSAIDYLAGNGPFADRQKHPLPCLVLLDLKLPKRSGLEVLGWIRQQSRLRGLVVIVLSSSALPSDVDRAWDLGANSFIEKPGEYEASSEFAKLLKGWWLTYHRFAGIDRPSFSRASHEEPGSQSALDLVSLVFGTSSEIENAV